MRRAMMLVMLAGVLPCAAQPIEWNNGAGGLWNDPLNWNPMNVPNVASETAHISLAGAYLVTLNTSPTVGGLFLNNAAATLSFQTGVALFINGATSTNNGLIVINATQGGAGTLLRADQNCVLSGTGRITLNAGGNLDTAYLQTSGASVLTNSAMHTIDGTGRIYADFANNGLVTANVNGRTLDLLSLPKSNNSIMRAENGGTLQISGVAVTQGPMGRIEAITGGQVSLVNMTVNGRIDSSGGGAAISGTTTFSGVELSGPLNVPSGSLLRVLAQGFENDGLVTVNPTQGGSGTFINYAESGALAGTGIVRLNAGANLDTAYMQTTAGQTITHVAPHAIDGTGRIHAAMVNDSLISANVNGRTIELLATNKTNNGVIEAVNGGTLQVSGINVMQGASGRFLADGGTLRFVNATTNGRVEADNGLGVLTGTVTWNTVHSSGPVEIPTGNTLLLRGTGLRNEGVVTVNPTAGGSATLIRFDEVGAFTGAGDIILNASTNRDTAYVDTNTGIIGTNGSAHTIRGTGRIWGEIINEGLISADVSGHSLELIIKPKINRGIMEAVNDATLLLTNVAVTQEAGGTLLADGGEISLVNSTVSGPIDSVNGSAISSGTVTLLDVSLDGSLGQLSASTILIRGSAFENNGVVTVNTTAGGSVTLIRFDENAEFAGSGEIVLNAGANLDTAYIHTNSGIVGTNGPAHTIRGRGRIHGAIDNNGLISADVDGRVLELLTAPKTNNGIIEAVNNATLQVNGITVTQNPGGAIRADGGHVSIVNSTINGDIDTTLGTGTVSGTVTFRDVTLEGPMGVANASSLRPTQSLVNNGTITINETAGGSVTTMLLLDNLTIEGTGTVLLNASANLDTAYIEGASAGITINFGEDQTLAGRGRIYKPLMMEGTMSPGNNGVGYLEPRAGYTQSSTGVYDCEVGGAGAGQFDQIAVFGQASLAGELRITRIGGFEPASCTNVPILTATGGVVGTFDTITGMSPGTNKIWRVFYGVNSVTLRSACYADFNGDCVFDIFDFLEWQNAFVTQNPEACNCDVTTGQSVCDIFDFLCFANLFAVGGC